MTENNKNRFTDNETNCLIDSSFTDNLTKKIYVIDEWERIIGLCNNLWEQTQRFEDYNKRLMEENEQLKEQLKDCQQKKQNIKDLLMNSEPIVEQKKLQKLIYQVVINLIDEKIEELEGWYKFGQEVYQGCPMHNIRFGINTLKELKKELEGDDRD